MASNNDPDNEDNIINTTIVELFALIIFLFIIALSAFSVWSEALYREAKPQEKLDDRGELQQKKIQPGQRDGIVLMPVFEGIPACLYRVNDVTYRESIKQTGNHFEFGPYTSLYMFDLEFDKIVGEDDLTKWIVQLRKNPSQFGGRVDSWAALDRAWCALYHAENLSTEKYNTTQNSCTLKENPVPLEKSRFEEIKSSFPSVLDQENNKRILDIFIDGKDGARDEFRGYKDSTSLYDLLEFSFDGDRACRWGIRIVKDHYCNTDTLNNNSDEKTAILRLNFFNQKLGYNFSISGNQNLENGKDNGFSACLERYGFEIDDEFANNLPDGARAFSN